MAAKKSSSKKLAVKLVRSPIGADKSQKGTIRALGFRRVLQTVTHKDTTELRGMLAHVSHLVEVVEA
jgi:large subunit ribosomal protein L30